MTATLRWTLECLVAPARAHEKHSPAQNYTPPQEAVVIGEGEFRYNLGSI
jgi:hypothetical protein